MSFSYDPVAPKGCPFATAERLASEGATLALSDVQIAGLEETAKRARELGAEVHAQHCDVADPARVAEGARRYAERYYSPPPNPPGRVVIEIEVDRVLSLNA